MGAYHRRPPQSPAPLPFSQIRGFHGDLPTPPPPITRQRTGRHKMGDKCDKFGRLCNGNGGEDEGKGVKWGRKDIKVNGGGGGSY